MEKFPFTRASSTFSEWIKSQSSQWFPLLWSDAGRSLVDSEQFESRHNLVEFSEESRGSSQVEYREPGSAVSS